MGPGVLPLATRTRREAPLDSSDVEPIARGQIAEAIAAEARATDLLVLDTDLVSTAVYARHYYGVVPDVDRGGRPERGGPTSTSSAAPTSPGNPDGQRDRGDRREEMHRLFETALGEIGAVVRAVRGSGPDREEGAAAAVEEALERRQSPARNPAG